MPKGSDNNWVHKALGKVKYFFLLGSLTEGEESVLSSLGKMIMQPLFTFLQNKLP